MFRVIASIAFMDPAEKVPPVTPVPPPVTPPTAPSSDADARTWAMWCHLSALSGYIVPMGNILGPLLIWQMKKDQVPSLEEHGKEAVNFQLSLLIYLAAGVIVALIGSFFCFGFLLFPALGAIGVAGVIFTIIAGVKANEGTLYRYPANLRLIK